MEYRGIKYTITRGTQQPVVWRWRTVVGDPAVLRTGEESSQLQAESMVRRLVDWSLSQAERSKRDESVLRAARSAFSFWKTPTSVAPLHNAHSILASPNLNPPHADIEI